MDNFKLLNRTNAKHKHRHGSKEHQIDHVLSNVKDKYFTVSTYRSLETISINNPDLGHPHFVIELGSKFEPKIYKNILITKWDKVISYLDNTDPITENQMYRPNVKKSAVIAEAIISWTKAATGKNCHSKRIKTNRKFNANHLVQPKHNPNQTNQKEWKNFYRAVNYLKENNCREEETATQLCRTQPSKKKNHLCRDHQKYHP